MEVVDVVSKREEGTSYRKLKMRQNLLVVKVVEVVFDVVLVEVVVVDVVVVVDAVPIRARSDETE